MTPERWERLQSIFDGAIDLAAGERAAFLDRACGEDAGLRAEVESLLTASEADDGTIERAIERAARRVTESTPARDIGRRIGQYRLVATLGEGGMGAVYLAERVDAAFEQQVALKVLSANRASRELRLRFRSEQQILANLHHPNIAQLLDGGTTDDGVPYLVMEYLEGEPIDRYCDQQRLTVSQRLGLFCTICAAVHYAHQNLVVHRDIKPSNILVTAGGVPKLLDFGIAKILDEQRSPHTLAVTSADMRVMTPDYASPEQVRGERVTTATDVYLLGVLLYRLLCGRLPHRFPSYRAHDVERVIYEVEPVAPSSALTDAQKGEPGAAEIAAARSTTQEQLRRRLSGDLDNIVLMALRKEPVRRYPSALQLAGDIRLHLDGMPVLARKDTWGYRTSKFVRRHRFGVAMSTVVGIMLGGFAASMSIQTERIAAERDVAELERQRAQQVSRLLEDLFVAADPREGEELTVREILDGGAERITQRLGGQPQIQARLLETIGRVYHHIGRNDEAVVHLRRALEIRRELLPAVHADVASSLTSLGAALYETGDYDEAERLHREALDIQQQLSPQPDAGSAAVLNQLGWVLFRKERLEEAASAYRDALTLYVRLEGADSPNVAKVLTNLAQVAHFRGEYTLAEQHYRQALEIGRRSLPSGHPDVSDYLYNLASLLHERGDLEQAEPLYQEALQVTRTALGPDHPELAIVLSGLGRLQHDHGDLDSALGILEQAVSLAQATRGESHTNFAYHLVNLAFLRQDRGELAQAGQMFERALVIYRDTLPGRHAYIAVALTGLGDNLTRRGQPQAAEPLIREALAMWAELRPEGHWQPAVTRSVLGASLAAQGRVEEALSLLREAHAFLRGKRGDGDRRTCAAALRLASFDPAAAASPQFAERCDSWHWP